MREPEPAYTRAVAVLSPATLSAGLSSAQTSAPTTHRRYSLFERWHLASLDAPLVAGVWTAFLARLQHVELAFDTFAALVLAVWIIYAVDRLLDGFGGDASSLRERHYFHRRHALLLCSLLAVAAPLLALLVWRLPAPLRWAWPLLSLPTLLYAMCVHLLRWPRVPKELLVSLLFTAVVALPSIALPAAGHRAGLPAVASAAAMLLACFANLAIISAWEGDMPRPALLAGTPAAMLSGAILLLCAAFFAPLAATAAALSALCLAALHRCRHSISPVHLRALADVALLTPLLLWPLA